MNQYALGKSDASLLLIAKQSSHPCNWAASFLGCVSTQFYHSLASCRYGPFWVATTLVFVSAVTGNYASYISYKHNHSESQTAMDSWFYDIDKVLMDLTYMACNRNTPCAFRDIDCLCSCGRLAIRQFFSMAMWALSASCFLLC